MDEKKAEKVLKGCGILLGFAGMIISFLVFSAVLLHGAGML